MMTLRPRAWISSLRRHILRARRLSCPSICLSWTSEARRDTYGISGRVDRMLMPPPCDSEPRLEGGSDPVKIQVRVGPSRIAGQGLFAAQDITKGTRIIQYIGEKIASRERARRLAAGNAYLFTLSYRYALDGQALENTARYINHSC